MSDDLFKLKIVTLNRNNPKSIYIDGGIFISLKEKLDVNDDVDFSLISKRFKNEINNFIKDTKIFEHKTISDFQFCADRISVGKRSYATFQCFMQPKKGNENFNYLCDVVEPMTIKLKGIIKESVAECNAVLVKRVKK